MNIIEKLEALLNANRFALVNDDCTTTDIIAVSDLRAILEEYKATEQAPVVMAEFKNGFVLSTLWLTLPPDGKYPLFTHPQPSDEAVKEK